MYLMLEEETRASTASTCARRNEKAGPVLKYERMGKAGLTRGRRDGNNGVPTIALSRPSPEATLP